MTRTYDKPQEGYFRLRLVKGGPFVPASIYRPAPWETHEEWWGVLMRWTDRWPALQAEIFGEDYDIDKVWESGVVIPKSEYDYLRDVHRWAVNNEQDHPLRYPRKPINLKDMESIF